MGNKNCIIRLEGIEYNGLYLLSRNIVFMENECWLKVRNLLYKKKESKDNIYNILDNQ